MTMLDSMRRHKAWLKWSLALVVLAFVVFYIPDFLQPGDTTGATPGGAVARVDDRVISAADFTRVYNTQVQAYRSAYGGNLNTQLLKQLGLDRQILQQLIDEEAASAEADRLGLTASDAEVRERIMTMPVFQENGQFVGEARYKALLRMQRPPLSHGEFEENIRRGLVLDKLRVALTDWVTVSDQEVDQEYRRRNEKVKLQFVALTADRFREGLGPGRERDRLDRMIGYARTAGACRRRTLLALIGQRAERCAGCDVCDGTAADATPGEREILSFVAAHPRRFAAERAAEVLAGRCTPRVARGFLDGVRGFGGLGGWDRSDVEEAIRELVVLGRLRAAGWPWRGALTSVVRGRRAD